MATERVIMVRRRLKLSRRTCAACGRTFDGWGRQRFCTPTCQKRWDYHAHADKRREARRERHRRQRAEQERPQA